RGGEQRPQSTLGHASLTERKVMEEDRLDRLEQRPLVGARAVKPDCALDGWATTVEALQRMLPVPEPAPETAHELLPERLEVQRMPARDVVRGLAGIVVDTASADDPEPLVERVQILPDAEATRAVRKLVRVQPQPPDVLRAVLRRDAG